MILRCLMLLYFHCDIVPLFVSLFVLTNERKKKREEREKHQKKEETLDPWIPLLFFVRGWWISVRKRVRLAKIKLEGLDLVIHYKKQ